MRHIRSRTLFAALTVGLGLTLGVSGPAKSEEALITFKILAPDVALKVAEGALSRCRAEGYQVAVAVVDRFGIQQVLLRDRFAGPHTPSTATRKAWTAVSFRSDTVALSELTQAGGAFSGIRHIDGALMVGGGVPIEAGGSIVGGVGVSGAPSGTIDSDCAKAGIAAVEEDIAF